MGDKMITTTLLGFGLTILTIVLSVCSFVQVPTEVIANLADITSVAAWIVGSDLLLLCFSSIAAWYTARFAISVFYLFLRIKG